MGKHSPERADTLVIGAGIAGLTAATHLQEAGQQVIVLEARKRPGGRIHTGHMAGTLVEQGAERMHGGDPRLLSFAEKYALKTFPAVQGRRYLGLNGGRLIEAGKNSVPDVDDLYDALVRKAGATGGESTVSHLLQKFSPRGVPPDLRGGLRAALYNLVTSQHATDASHVHLSSLCEDETAESGADSFVQGGFSLLPRRMAAGLHVRYNTVICGVESSRTRGVRITATDNREFHAKKAIVTLPLGVLKAESVRFEPRLPPQKTKSIHALQCGNLYRILLALKPSSCPQMLRETEDIVMDDPSLQWVWQMPVLSSQEAHEKNTPLILTALIGGKAAETLSTWPQEKVTADALSHLGRFFHANLENACLGKRGISWGADPFARMAYPWCPEGARDARWMKTLGQPTVSGLYFAGDATHHDGDYGTTGCAVETGWRAAGGVLAGNS